jgi:hypothetical protein
MVRAIVTAVRNVTYVCRLAAASNVTQSQSRREPLQIQLFLQKIRDIE